MQIYSTAQRDRTYLDLARQALCIQDYATFDAIVSKIYTTTIRDQGYVDGVDFTVGIKKFEKANGYAKSIYQTTQRDAAMQRIAVATASGG